MNRTIRHLLIAAMVASIGLILWFPPGSAGYINGYIVIIAGLVVVCITARKEQKKKK